MNPKQRILLVDDDPDILDAVGLLLQHEGYSVSPAKNAKEAMRQAYDVHPDLVLLDVTLPDEDGFSVLQRLRDQTDVPILMITARTSVEDRVRGLDLDAVDYILKPFANDELLARIRRRLREDRRHPPGKDVVVAGGLAIDFTRHLVRVDGKEASLTPIEWRLLRELVQAGGRVVTPEELLRAGWGESKFRDERSIKVRISAIRRKIGDRPRPSRYIHTEREEGYRFEAKR